MDLRRWAIALPLLATVFAPRSAVIQSPILTFGTIGTVMGLGLIAILNRHRGINKAIIFFWVLLFLISLITTCSQILNTYSLVTSGISRIFRPFLYVVLIAYGYKVAARERVETINPALLWATYLIIAGQIFVGISQLLGAEIFELVYTSTKASASKIRTTGTLANPNLFGWVIIQSASLVFILEDNRKIKYTTVILCAVMVVLSGSRTSLIVFPIVLSLHKFISVSLEKKWSRLIAFLFCITICVTVFYIFVLDYFPYLRSINNIFKEDSLAAVNSLRARFINWNTNAEKFYSGGWRIWILGLSDIPSTQVLDNDYLYVLFRTGVLGFALHLYLIYNIISYLLYNIKSKVSQVCTVYILSSLIVGLVSETLGGWFYPMWPMYFLGIVIGEQEYE